MYDLTDAHFRDLVMCYHNRTGENVWEHEKADNVQDLAEIWLYRSLMDHPNRTYDPAEADLFFIPMFPVMSFRVGKCMGMTHTSRMDMVATVLRDDPYFKRNGGSDHLIVCGWYKCRRVLRALNEVLHLNETALLSIHERLQPWSGWHCPEKLIIHPYVANAAITQNPVDKPFLDRTTSFFFVGCVRRMLERQNCRIIRYLRQSYIHVHNDCTKFKVDAQQYSEIVGNSKFCLVPRGDTYTSRRLYDAVAAGCIPVLQDGGIRDTLPFSWKLNYTEFAIFAPNNVFRDPMLLLQFCVDLLMRDQTEFQLMQDRLFQARNELIWGGGNPFGDDPHLGSVGNNVLEEALTKLKASKRADGADGGHCRGKWVNVTKKTRIH